MQLHKSSINFLTPLLSQVRRVQADVKLVGGVVIHTRWGLVCYKYSMVSLRTYRKAARHLVHFQMNEDQSTKSELHRQTTVHNYLDIFGLLKHIPLQFYKLPPCYFTQGVSLT